jgi:uncharacterized caspase-like protein
MLYAVRFTLLILCAVAGLNLSRAEARRVALVVGNANHKFLANLQNPINDAAAVAEALEKLNFDKVILKKDLGFAEFRIALREFSREAKGAEAGVVFFGGNGVQVGGRDYLVPVDAKLEKAADAVLESIGLDTVIEHVAEARLGLIILDACRDDARIRSQTRGVHRGVTLVERGGVPALVPAPAEPGHNTFVVYSALPGASADDGAGRHSPFTAALLKHLTTPGLELRHVFVRVRADVIVATRGLQSPETWDRFNGEFFFNIAR